MEMLVQKLTQEDSGRLAAKLLASSTYPSVPCMWGRAWRLLGKHRPSLGRGCDTVRKLFRKLCLPGCVVWIRVKRSKRQRDWFCGSVAMTVHLGQGAVAGARAVAMGCCRQEPVGG